MSSSQPARKTRSTNLSVQNHEDSTTATAINELTSYLHCSTEFIHLYKQLAATPASRSALISTLCQILLDEKTDQQILLFILDCLTSSYEYLNENQFKQNLLPFIKQTFLHTTPNTDLVLSVLRLLRTLVESRTPILQSTLAEWLSCLFNFLVAHLTPSNYTVYQELILDLLDQIIENFTPLSKEILEILSRSSSVTSASFLQQLKSWIKNSDDLRLALFAIHLWQLLASVLNRLVIRGHSRGNEILAVIEDAFIVSNYSIRSAAFTSWSAFILNIQQLEEFELTQLNTRLLKLFLTPFLSDSTSKSKSASIAKCRAWIQLISVYPTNVHDVILPFLAFAFGNHLSGNIHSTTTAWWSECRQIGGEFLNEFLQKNIHGEFSIKLAADQILNYLFDFLVDQLLTPAENSFWLNSWNVYLNHLMNIFKTNNAISEERRVAINTCLLTRIEQLWIDARIETHCLLKLFEAFERIGFPLAIETVLRDSSTRTKTLSAAQIHPSSGNYKSQEKSLSFRTTLSDQYLHMMLEHAIRFNDEDLTNEESYLHVLTYLIDTLSKTSDENFCAQASSLLLKCAVEYAHQPLVIPTLFWHIWFRCSTHLINILNRSHTFELNNKIDNQKQETAIELLLRPFAFHDVQRLDYSYTLLWIQLYKALCRLILMNNDHLIDFIIELIRNEPAFEQAITNHQNQRLFGLILIILKTLLKTFSEIDLIGISNQFVQAFSSTQKRTSIGLCFTQFSIILNHILKRLLSESANNTQYILVCNCLVKSTKISSIEQSKLFVWNYVRDLIVDLLNTCKAYSHLDLIVQNLTQLIPFLCRFEQSLSAMTMITASPISKQQFDNVILNKVLSVISLVFEPTNSSALLQLIYPLLILAFQHPKAILRNKARKCWNETFGRMTFIVYPNELRMCLRDLKDKEHLLLPCFLADHDNSNTAGSGHIASSTDESQLSQQIDIPAQLITYQQKSFSPARATLPANRSMAADEPEPVFVPILQKPIDSPVSIGQRLSTINSCLTEKQKEKLRARHAIPLLCDDNTQSNSATVDALTADANNSSKRISTGLSLFNQPIAATAPEENESNAEPTDVEEENIPEESSISKKLRRSCRPSLSARKSLVNNSKKNMTIPVINELTAPVVPAESATEEQPKKPLIKGILKRLSPTKARRDHARRVVFHDQVKVLVFPSPSRRDSIAQMKKKSPNREDLKSPTRIIPKENLPLRKQPMSARRLSVMNANEPIIPSSPMTTEKTRASKLFHPNDALADWTQTQLPLESNENQSPFSAEEKTNGSIYPSLVNCAKSIDILMNILYDGLCPTDTLQYFRLKKMRTIGDIARAPANQIEICPIPTPKLANMQKALQVFSNSLCNDQPSASINPVASCSEETSPSVENGSSIEIEAMLTSTQEKLYDVDILIDSLDCDKLYLHDETPNSERKRTRRQILSLTDDQFSSPQKRCLSPPNDIQQTEPMKMVSPKKSTLTLGDRLRKAADAFQSKGTLPFDDEYIELVRQLFHNSSLTHLEQLHLKTFVLNG